MSIRTEYQSHRKLFQDRHSEFVERLLSYTTQDIETRIKIDGRTPVDTGAMKADIRSQRLEDGTYQVVSPKEYSSPQERGGSLDGTVKYSNYTTPGTGSGWFVGAVKETQKHAYSLVNEVARMMKR